MYPTGTVLAAAFGGLMVLLAWSFAKFNCLSYGMSGPLRDMSPLMWMSSWELDR